jgi:hypothetical protein
MPPRPDSFTSDQILFDARRRIFRITYGKFLLRLAMSRGVIANTSG